MQKPLSNMAKYIKDILPANIPEEYTLKTMFLNISDEATIRNGVLAFRDLLYLICDRLIADGCNYDNPPKNTNKDNHDRPSLAASYPFIDNIKSVLFNIGDYGELTEDGVEILINNWQTLTFSIGADGRQLKSKISVPKLIECLRFLTFCGVCFEGIDLDAEKPDMSKVTALKIFYPNNSVMLTGLKIMATAQKELYTNGNHDIFLRCDYRVLKDEETKITSVLKDFLHPLSTDIQDFALRLHQRYLDAGLTCRRDISYLVIRFIYSYKNKEIWAFSSSPSSGYRIFIKAQNTHQYADVIAEFPFPLREKIARGYGCEKKKYGEPCQKGCRGFSFSLDSSVVDISRDIEMWLDKELSCLQKK